MLWEKNSDLGFKKKFGVRVFISPKIIKKAEVEWNELRRSRHCENLIIWSIDKVNYTYFYEI